MGLCLKTSKIRFPSVTPHIGPHTVGKPYLKSVYTVKRAKMNLTNLNAIPTGCQASHLLTREINLKNKRKTESFKNLRKINKK